MEHIRKDLKTMLLLEKSEHEFRVDELQKLLKQINYYEKKIIDSRNKIEELQKLLGE